MSKEIWKPIPEFLGYEVSNKGRVRSVDRIIIHKNGIAHKIKGKILSPVDNGNGYLFLQLGKNNRRYVHRLVAQAFLQNPDKLPEVNHIDTNKKNNSANNLEWCSSSENIKHAYSTNLIKPRKGINHHNANFTMKQVRHIRKICIPHDKENGVTALAKKYNVDRDVISNIIHNRTYKE